MTKQKMDDETLLSETDVIETDESIKVDVYKQNVYHIYLDDEIKEPSNYRNIFNVLRDAKETDVVVFVINTSGGNVSSTIQFHNYLLATMATTVAEIHCAHSAGSVIALTCDEIYVAPYSSMMIHSMTTASFGKVHELDGHLNFINHFNKRLLKEIYDTFLTDKEIEAVISGKDIWFMEDEINQRLKKWKPLRLRLFEKAQEGEKHGRNARKNKKIKIDKNSGSIN